MRFRDWVKREGGSKFCISLGWLKVRFYSKARRTSRFMGILSQKASKMSSKNRLIQKNRYKTILNLSNMLKEKNS